MTAEPDREPSAPEMFTRSRMKNQTGVSDERSTFVDERAREILESYAARLKEYVEEHGIQDANDVPLDVQNQLYLDVGWRKGTVLGLGSEVITYYQKPRSGSSVNTNATLTAELEQTTSPYRSER
ncbi:hypothetical protein Drorol1_Dr00020750 [Drosera rotundifolia]